MKHALLLALTLLPLLAAPLRAAVDSPNFVDYQGMVFDSTTGAPLGSAGTAPNFTAAAKNYTMQFRIFGSQAGTDLIYAESQTVTVTLGAFSVRLGSGAPIAGLIPPPTKAFIQDAFDGADRFLELTVFPTGASIGTPITPRLKFQSAPFAFTAKHAAVADEVIGKVTATAGSTFANGSFANGSFTGGNFAGGTFAGNGASLTNLDASKITTGTLNKDRIPGLDASKITTGKLAEALFSDPFPLTNLNVSGTASVAQLTISSRILVPSVEFWDSSLRGGLFKKGSTGSHLGSTSAATGEMVLSGASGKLHLQTGTGTSAITIDTSNRVGIGTTTPTQAKLVVSGSVSGNAAGDAGFSYTVPTLNLTGRYINRIYGAYTSDVGISLLSGQGLFPILARPATSIYADGAIWSATNLVSSSDARIKNIQGRSDSIKDLDTLVHIEVADYRYKDVIGKGNAPQKKVVAQQLEKVYPQAVSKQMDAVPDIYQQAFTKDGWITLATDLKKGDRVKLISETIEEVHEVLEVTTDKFLTDFRPEGDQVFVYGREVNDFRTVDYDAIAMLNVSATQQIKKELDAVKAENESLRAQVKQLAERDEARETRLIAVEKLLATPAQAAVRSVSLNTAAAH